MAKALTHDDFEDAAIITTQNAEDISAQQADADEQINSIFSEVGTSTNAVDYHFQVWRVLKDQADMAFLFKGVPSDLPIMERLRDEYEGGKFHIQIYRNKKRYKQLKVTVEQPKKAAVTAIVKNDMAEMVKVLAEQQERQFAMLRETMMQIQGKSATPQPSQMEMMAGMMTLLSGMKAFVTPAPAPDNSFGPEKMMDLLIKGMELGRESGSGGGGDGDSFMGLARDLIKSPLLGQLASAVASQPRIAAPQVARPAVPVQTLANPATNSAAHQPAQEQTDMNPVIRHNVNMLVSKAEQDSDPVLYAEFILDNVPESMVREYVMRDDLIEYFSAVNPKVKTYEKWFLEMREHIKAVLTEDDVDPTLEQNPADLSINTNDPGTDHDADHTAGDGGDAGNA